MTELLCVRCNQPLNPALVEGQQLLACPAGHGLWLDRAQLIALVNDDSDDASPAAEAAAWTASTEDPAAMSTGRFSSCPVCAKTLRKDNWKYGSGVVVDTCDEHGMWVDSGEIEQIEAWEEAWAAHRA